MTADNRISRSDFLRLAGMAGASLVLSRCKLPTPTRPSENKPTSIPEPKPTNSPFPPQHADSYDACIESPGSKLVETYPEQCVDSSGDVFVNPNQGITPCPRNVNEATSASGVIPDCPTRTPTPSKTLTETPTRAPTYTATEIPKPVEDFKAKIPETVTIPIYRGIGEPPEVMQEKGNFQRLTRVIKHENRWWLFEQATIRLAGRALDFENCSSQPGAIILPTYPPQCIGLNTPSSGPNTELEEIITNLEVIPLEGSWKNEEKIVKRFLPIVYDSDHNVAYNVFCKKPNGKLTEPGEEKEISLWPMITTRKGGRYLVLGDILPIVPGIETDKPVEEIFIYDTRRDHWLYASPFDREEEPIVLRNRDFDQRTWEILFKLVNPLVPLPLDNNK